MEKRNSILIVDDDTSNLMELTHILKSDYKIHAVRDGISALEKAAEYLPDLILLDVIMPDMNGFEVLSELKKSEKTMSIPVIFITGISAESNESEGLAIGAVDYIRKPFDATVIKLRVGQQIKIVNLQRDLESAVEVAEAANKSKSSFLANMSHEIRTPMNAIMGITDIMMQSERLSDETADGLDKIYASSEMLLGIINDILDFSKIEAGKLDIMPAEYKLASLISDAVHLNMMRIGNRPIKFELQVDEDIPAVLVGDELRIKQVLNNLLSNAFKYTDTGTVSLAVTFEPLAEICNDFITLMFSVRDTGHGMTETQLDKLFDEYSRFNEESAKAIEGTGLGLAITQRLINLTGGTILVESELGKGSLFTVSLPQKKEGSAVLGKEIVENLCKFRTNYMTHRKRNQITRSLMPYGSVLIVDDTETNLFVAAGLMKLYKLRIETALSGQEVIDKIKNGSAYDIIFMDHMMPEMDGIQATVKLRELGYHAPIVALTANAVAGQSEIFLANGFDDFVSKPIDIHRLDLILNKHIRDKQPPEVVEAANLQENISEKAGSAHDSMLFESVIRDTRKAVAVLEELLGRNAFEDENDLRRFTVTVHGMKSSLGAINEAELSKTAAMLEEAGRDKDTERIKLTAPKFLKELQALPQRLEAKLNQNGANDKEEDESSEEFRDKLTAVMEMCADYNRKGVLDALAGFGKCSDKTKALLDNIKELVLYSDFDEAERMIQEYL
ncbi:MAG: response regulator [Oscillospiraceae bacterium]|nr:response regulator [Oscillospiraceae bacterium]